MSYAYISYYTAYLKYYYTIEFFAALMTVFGDDKDKVLSYIKDAERFGIEVRTPDINRSEKDFSIANDNTIIYGFDSVKSLPERGIESILKNRPFDSVEDIVAKTQKSDINKTAVDKLTWSGALDSLHGSDRLNTLKRFYAARGDAKRNEDLPESISKRKLLNKEKELLGIYLTEHPLDEFNEDVDWEEAKKTGERINVYGIITDYRVIQTKKGDDMAFVDMEFQDEYVNGVMFPNVFSKEVERRKGSKVTPLGRFVQEDVIVKVSAYFNEDYRGGLSFVIADMVVPVRVNADMEDVLLKIEEQYGREPDAPLPEPDRPAPKIIEF